MSRTRLRKHTPKRCRVSRRVPRNRRKPNYLILFCVFALAAGFSGAAAFAFLSPSLDVKKVKIDGIRLTDRAAVEAQARAAIGRNILLLRKSPILARISGISEVRNVKMGRSLPNKIWVRVWERQADAVVTDGRRWCMIESNGFMFHLTDGPRRGLPVIGVEGRDFIRRGKIARQPSVRHALEVLACSRREGLKLGKISVDPQGDICLNMASDLCVKLGQPDEIARKMSKLRQALDCKPSIAKEALYIDLSCPAALVWKPKVVAQAAS